MSRKIIGLVLALAMLLSCLSGVALAAEEPVTITWYGVGGASDHQARVNEAASKYLQSKGLNVNLEYISVGWGDYMQNYQVMLAAGEAFDLFNAQGNTVMQFAKNGGVAEITDEMMDTLLPGVKAVAPAHVVEALKMDGKNWMVPSMHEWAQYYGFALINLDIVDALGLDLSTVKSLDDLDPIFEKVHAAYPDVYCIEPCDLKEIAMLLYNIGPANHLENTCVGLDTKSDDKDFFSFFENEKVVSILRKYAEWGKKGYVVPLDRKNDVNALRTEGKIFCSVGRFKPGAGAQSTNAVVRYGDMKWDENAAPIMGMKDAPAGWVTALSNTSKNKELALQVLNLFYTEPTLETLLTMGEEGVDYTVADDGFVDFVDGGFANGVFANRNWQIGNSALLPVSRGYADLGLTDIWQVQADFNNSAVALESAGFFFDTENVDIEMAALVNVYDEFSGILFCGVADDFDATLNQFVEKLKANGLQTVLDECNRQYDEFLANKAK